MMKHCSFAAAALFVLASCSHDLGGNVAPSKGVSESEIKSNVEKVFGVTFDPNHDWCTTTSGEVTIHADASVKKVQVLAYVCEIDDPSVEYDVTRNAVKVLNEAETNGQSSVKLKYDAPKDNLGLYVAFITNRGYNVKKVVNGTVSFDGGAQARATRALPEGYTLPVGEFAIGTIEDSYASTRGWIPGEKLYALADYTDQKISSPDYSDEFKEVFRGIVFSYFPNGRNFDNLPKVKSSGYYNSKVYPITTGEDPIVLTPIYKCDKATRYGNEVYNSDLYYYYFKEENLGADPVAYLESLPKYKAIQFNQCFGETEDDVIGNHGSYALLYFGDGTPEIGTVGSYQFPKGYKIGFMVRAKTTAEGGKKQGEVYGDGRLNNYINNYDKCNFRSSKLGEDGPRVAWLSLNDKMLMSWESGTDADFNDIILEIEGGIEPFDNIPEIDKEVYTYCFEDTRLGDYDMNDVVIKAVRENKTTVKYSIVACGAYSALYIRNINCGVITDDAEVHELFGTTPNNFVNTQGDNYPAITVLKTVSESFSFLDPSTYPYIYNKDIDDIVRISERGEDPHGIMIPNNFRYPSEKVCIKDAFLKFNAWGQNPISSVEWYLTPVENKVHRSVE